MKNSKLLIVLLSVLLVSLSGCGEKKPDEWVNVTDGECFTSKKGSYINYECFKTKKEAEEDIAGFIAFSATKKKHKSRIWQKAN